MGTNSAKKQRSIVLCVVYRTDYCPVSCFIDDFMDKYSQALTFGKNIIVAADLNCDMLKLCSPEPVRQRESDAVDQGADSRD